MLFENLIVGAGFAGCVVARRMAEELDRRVVIIDRRNHIGGNAYDYYNDDGILIHKYGPHIFHTDNAAVWRWLSRFTEWHSYQHRVLAYVDGRLVPLPISVETVNALYGTTLTVDEFSKWLEERKVALEAINTSEDAIVASAGRDIYEKIFKNYTFKQWGKYPNELDASISRRIPVRLSRDTRYFTNKYQGLPKLGYTRMFENILNHPNIRVMLNADWNELKKEMKFERLVYTGAIDEFYDYQFGKLNYRSVRFEYQTFRNREHWQSVGTVNYPNDYDYTRITEYKYLTGQEHPHTTIAREYPSDLGEPFYIVPGSSGEALNKYMHLGDGKTLFVGRLAEYKYYNMDQIVEKALSLVL